MLYDYKLLNNSDNKANYCTNYIVVLHKAVSFLSDFKTKCEANVCEIYSQIHTDFFYSETVYLIVDTV